MLFPGGYTEYIQMYAEQINVPHDYYYNTDYIGNNWDVVDNNGAVVQRTEYSAFGIPFPNMVGDPGVQPYKYSGKEFDQMHGLNWYDFSARMYDPLLGRFNSIDPLAENDYEVSPYVYCANNPIKYIDLDGKEKISLFPKTGTEFKNERDYWELVPDNECINIYAHGDFESIEDNRNATENNRGESIKPDQFIKEILSMSKTWNNRKEGQHLTIVLYCCNTANEIFQRNSFARLLSKKLKNVTIIAPSKNVFLSNKGYIGCYDAKFDRNRIAYYDPNDKGNWYTYIDGKKTFYHPGDWRPINPRPIYPKPIYPKPIDWSYKKYGVAN